MSLHPLLDAFNDRNNLKNFLLVHSSTNDSTTLIYPTNMSGAYTRLKFFQNKSFETLVEANITLCNKYGGTSIFKTTPTEDQLDLIKEMVDDINQTFFTTPVIDLNNFKIIHCTAEKIQHILGDVFMQDENGNVLQLSNGIMYT